MHPNDWKSRQNLSFTAACALSGFASIVSEVTNETLGELIRVWGASDPTQKWIYTKILELTQKYVSHRYVVC